MLPQLNNPFVFCDVLSFLNYNDLENVRLASKYCNRVVKSMEISRKHDSKALIYISNSVVETYNPLWSVKVDKDESLLSSIKSAPLLSLVDTIILDGIDLTPEEAKALAVIIQTRIPNYSQLYFTPQSHTVTSDCFDLLQYLKPKNIIVKNFLDDETTIRIRLNYLLDTVKTAEVIRLEKYYNWFEAIVYELSHIYWRFSKLNQGPVCYVRLWKPF